MRRLVGLITCAWFVWYQYPAYRSTLWHRTDSAFDSQVRCQAHIDAEHEDERKRWWLLEKEWRTFKCFPLDFDPNKRQ